MRSWFILLIILLLLAAPVFAASGTVLQPVRTVPGVTTAPTAPPAPSAGPARVATTAPVFITCTAPASCMSEDEAIAAWGSENFVKDTDQACGSEPSRTGDAVRKYCYRQAPGSTGVQKTGRSDIRIVSGLPTAVPSPAGTQPATARVSGVASIKSVETPLPERTGAIPEVTTEVPVTKTTPLSAQKPSSVVDSVMSFLATVFGGGKSSGNSQPPAGGDMEPTPALPSGMQPVTQVTTAKPKPTMDSTITVTSPVAGAQYFTGDAIPVKWTKPANPSGTVNLKLVSQDGMTQTVWGTAVVPNTGSFDWHQQDLAHDCGVGNNPACWGGLNPDTLGITNPIQYQNAWNLPAYNQVRVEISTDAMDPYPAFYGTSGTFTLKNGHAFVSTKLEQTSSFKAGDYPAQVTTGSGQASPWVGYRNRQNGNDPAIYHEMWRTAIIPDFGSGFSTGDTIKKATLILTIKTDKQLGNSAAAYSTTTSSAVAHVWILDAKPSGYPQQSALAVSAAYDLPAAAGSNAHGSYDPATGTVTVDLTDPVNQWFKKAGSHVILLAGPDESGSDNLDFFYSRIESVTFIVEKA